MLERENLSGKRVTVVGLGRFGGGIGVTRWLCGQGARVTVTDSAPADALGESIARLGDCGAELHLGGHDPADFTDADMLVVSPAVPPTIAPLQAARDAGLAMTTEINLFIARCPATLVGITGSVGKSTTTAMVGEILARRFTTHVGGNIGRSLLEDLPQIAPDHVVVLELSSFQLESLPQVAISPRVAVVTNLMPNHLDRHGNMDAYAAAKMNLFAFQGPADTLVLNADCPATRNWAKAARGRVVFFSAGDDPFELAVPGGHNQANAQAAWQACRALGVDRPTASQALRQFGGLPHRLNLVCKVDEVRYFNDSKCTTPQGAMVALDGFDPRRVVMIVGGYDKGASFAELGRRLAERAKAVIAIGATAGKIVAAVEAATAATEAGPLVRRAGSLPDAVAAARELAEPGDAVLLSPACASYDMFDNYEQRGELFERLARPIT